MNRRLEHVLLDLAQEHAPELIPADWAQQVDYDRKLRTLARQLADHHILVMMAVLPDKLAQNPQPPIETWLKLYADFYQLLASATFPSGAQLEASLLDALNPAIVTLYGAARPVVQVMAGLLLPYIARRQTELLISEAELRGLMSLILEALAAEDLPYEDHHQLQVDGVSLLRQMLSSPLRLVSLTRFDRPFFYENRRPEQLPELDSLTEDSQPLLPVDERPPTTDTAQKRNIPLMPWLDDNDDEGRSKRPPPVPPLPRR
ncbi:MAG: hypothetical protein D6712_01355 [Chloroflexi bacterium]|nr:MAG: hypothetical protein D6712_01355 [Chloroflexota bacterium]